MTGKTIYKLMVIFIIMDIIGIAVGLIVLNNITHVREPKVIFYAGGLITMLLHGLGGTFKLDELDK